MRPAGSNTTVPRGGPSAFLSRADADAIRAKLRRGNIYKALDWLEDEYDERYHVRRRADGLAGLAYRHNLQAWRPTSADRRQLTRTALIAVARLFYWDAICDWADATGRHFREAEDLFYRRCPWCGTQRAEWPPWGKPQTFACWDDACQAAEQADLELLGLPTGTTSPRTDDPLVSIHESQA